jgi:hypothetical protein
MREVLVEFSVQVGEIPTAVTKTEESAESQVLTESVAMPVAAAEALKTTNAVAATMAMTAASACAESTAASMNGLGWRG